MVRDLEQENQKIRNGNRYIYDSESQTGVFPRDVDRLFIEYANLRNKLYSKYRVNFSDEASREELRSYIDEQFIKLVKEYDVNSPVDFPGYIKTKLYARVSQGFVKKKEKDYGRENVTSEEGTLEETLESKKGLMETDMEIQELLDYIFQDVNMKDYERDIVQLWLNQESDTQVRKKLKEVYAISVKDINKAMEDLRELVSIRLDQRR